MKKQKTTTEQVFQDLVLKNKIIKLQKDSKVIKQMLKQFAVDYSIIRKKLREQGGYN